MTLHAVVIEYLSGHLKMGLDKAGAFDYITWKSFQNLLVDEGCNDDEVLLSYSIPIIIKLNST